MLRNITLGQYYPGDSILHRLDPRIKIVATLFYIAALFLVKDALGFWICTGFLLWLIWISDIQLSFMLKGLHMVLAILVLVCCLSIFTTEGKSIAQLGFLTISSEGVYRAGMMIFRLVYLIAGSSLLTLTTRPVDLTDGIEKLLSPFQRFGLRGPELAMMMGITLRFIPILMQEADKMIKSQSARGADLESGNILRRAQNLLPIIVPLLVGAIRTSQDLALAMDARCYQSDAPRTRMRPMVLQKRDVIALCLILLLIIVLILLRNAAILELLR